MEKSRTQIAEEHMAVIRAAQLKAIKKTEIEEFEMKVDAILAERRKIANANNSVSYAGCGYR
jgi:hypothetical protein